MKLLIHGINFSPELTGTGKYTGEMAAWFAEQGHEVRVITAPPYYPNWSIDKNFKNFYSTKKFKNISIIRCPLYVPKKPSSFKRILHLMSFSISSFFPTISSIFWRPDVVIQVAPTLFCSGSSIFLAKFTKAKSIIHIQDFEVDAMFGLSGENRSFVKKIVYFLEKKVIDSYDIISTISKGMINKAISKGISPKKILFFPNWTEIKKFKDKKKSVTILKSLDIDISKKIVLYSGNIGEKQGLEFVIGVAERLKNNKNLQFLFVGEGTAKKRLQDMSKSLKLRNVKFLPLLPLEMLPHFLACADCHLVIQKKGVGDSVLPSKLTNILAVGGNAVITSSYGTTLSNLCKDYPGIATLKEPESILELQRGIEEALKLSTPNKIAQGYANKFLDKSLVLKNFYLDIISFNKK
jgi:colanic acid biosynthesis glycosyl transferase WcaI